MWNLPIFYPLGLFLPDFTVSSMADGTLAAVLVLLSGGDDAAAGSASSTAGVGARDTTPSHDVRDDSNDETKQDEGDDDNDDDGQKESENLWRQMLAHDFGFCYQWDVRCGDPDGTLKGNMHLRTFRGPDEGEEARRRFRRNSRGQRLRRLRSRDSSFLRTDEEMVASNAFESWKRWEKLRLAFDMEARGGWVPHPLTIYRMIPFGPSRMRNSSLSVPSSFDVPNYGAPLKTGAKISTRADESDAIS